MCREDRCRGSWGEREVLVYDRFQLLAILLVELCPSELHRLIDRLHVAIAPILLGRGIRLWDDLRGLERGYTAKAETAESGTIHLTFQR